MVAPIDVPNKPMEPSELNLPARIGEIVANQNKEPT